MDKTGQTQTRMTEENKINTLPMPLGGNANINIVIEGPTCPIVLKILRTHNTLKYFLAIHKSARYPNTTPEMYRQSMGKADKNPLVLMSRPKMYLRQDGPWLPITECPKLLPMSLITMDQNGIEVKIAFHGTGKGFLATVSANCS